MSEIEIRNTANECQSLARTLSDHQDGPLTLEPDMVTNLVNALLNAGNVLQWTLANYERKNS